MIALNCRRCTEVLKVPTVHRLPNKVVKEIMDRAQEGELNTVKGNTVCLYTLYGNEMIIDIAIKEKA